MIRMMCDWLESQTHRVKVVEIRSHHFIAYFLHKILNKHLRLDESNTKRLSKIWNFLLFWDFLSIILLAVFKARICMFLGYYVLCERYVIDSIIDCLFVDYRIGINKHIKSLFMKLLYILPKKGIVIRLSTNYETLVHRYKKRHSHIEPRSWIFFQRAYQQKFCDIVGGFSISTDGKSTCEVFDEIKRIVL